MGGGDDDANDDANNDDDDDGEDDGDGDEATKTRDESGCGSLGRAGGGEALIGCEPEGMREAK